MHWRGGQLSLTIRERKSGAVRLCRLKKNTADEVARSIIKMLRGLPVKTITSDRGSEFVRWRRVEKALGAKWYVCDPHCPQQRGGVENMNGIIRGIVRPDIGRLGLRAALRRAEWIINNRPTPRHKKRSPAETLGVR